MTRRPPFVLLLFAALFAAARCAIAAVDPDAIGLTPLWREQPSLTGAGIPVGQSEGQYAANAWQVNPNDPAVAQPASLFTWISQSGSASTFPNGVGLESPHADVVGSFFYGTASNGVAPGVLHVRNYELSYYYSFVISTKTAQPDVVVNQSWIEPGNAALEKAFDEYAATFNVLFVSGMDNSEGAPPPPGSCYNGIGVGRGDGVATSIGPTAGLTAGRSKPDISVLPANYTSFLTPQVAGAAALLLQAAARNDGGAATALLATNSPVIKALLLNGAVKQPDWTNGPTRPLDARYGAGLLNIYNSWLQLRGGRAQVNITNTMSRGWDYSSIGSSTSDQTNHYIFNLSTNGGGFVGNVTLVWKAAVSGLSLVLANFDLQLADRNGQIVASSISTVDNVEHLFATNLPPGRYDLRVIRRGGINPGSLPNYALAFDFASKNVQVVRTNGTVIVSWPVNEAGFVLQSTSDVAPPINWQTVGVPSFVTNGLNTVVWPAVGQSQFFRLVRP